MKNQLLPSDYKETLKLIKQKIELAQQQAIISVNTNLLNLYWEVGNIILGKKEVQGWGTLVLKRFIPSKATKSNGSKGKNVSVA